MAEARMMSAADMARTSNEWMRRYIADPDGFAREFQTVTEFMADTANGHEPDYGQRCAAYQFALLDEMDGRTASTPVDATPAPELHP